MSEETKTETVATPADAPAKKKAKKRSKRKEPGKMTGFDRAVPVLLLGAAVFLALCFILKADNGTGIFGSAIGGFLLGLFSFGAHLIPLLLLVHAGFWYSDVVKRRRLSRLIFSILLVLTVSAIGYLVGYAGEDVAFSPTQFYADGKSYVGGGFLGGMLAWGLDALIGQAGMIVLASLMFILYVTFFFAGEKNVFVFIGTKLLLAIVTFFALIEKGLKKLFGKKKPDDAPRTRKDKNLAKQCDALLDDEYFSTDNGLSSLEINDLGIREVKSKEGLEANPVLQNKVYESDRTDSADRAESNLSSYADDFFGTDPAPRAEERPVTSAAPSHGMRGYGLDDNAADVFTSDFDPFDLAENAARAAKVSSRAESTGFVRVEEPVAKAHTETEEEKRMREFEEKKAAFLAKQAEDAARAEKERAEDERKRAEEAERLRREADAAELERERAAVAAERERMAKEAAYIAAERERLEAERSKSAYAAERVTPSFETPAETPHTTSLFDRMAKAEEEARPAATPYTPVFHDTPAEPPVSPQPEPTADTSESLDFEVVTDEAPADALRVSYEPVVPPVTDDESEEEDEPYDGSVPAEEGEVGNDEEIPPEKQNPLIGEYRGYFPFLDRESESDETPTDEIPTDDAPADTPVIPDVAEDEPEEDEPPFDLAKDISSRFTDHIKSVSNAEKEAPKAYVPPDYSNYKYPSPNLLDRGEDFEESPEIKQEIADRCDALLDVLTSFNVTATIKGVDRGPRVTRYEVVPARGVKVSSITNLYNDISLGLACDSIRMEAPIPGKSAIGFEIPNRTSQTVHLRDLIESPEFVAAKSKTYACLGEDVTGNPVFADIASMPHLLVAGATGMGKSVCINAILMSLLFRARPDELKFIMVDPKRVEFKMYNGLPHLLIPVVTDVKLAAGALSWAVEEMHRRYDLIETLHVKKIDDYNAKVRENPEIGQPLPKIIIVIDELNDLMIQVRDPVEKLIMSIAQLARAAGIHLIIGTQRPSVNVITGLIKANIPSRIACKVMSNVDSRTILDASGAETLLGKGDMLFNAPGFEKPIRVQGAFVSDNEIEKVLDVLKKNAGEAVYDEAALDAMQQAAAKCGNKKKGGGGDDDEEEDYGGYLSDQQFLDAVDVVLRMGKASTSMLQTKLAIGFQKASRYISVMSDLGIVSDETEGRFKKVLITPVEWEEKLARSELD